MHCFWDKEKPIKSRAVHKYLQDLGGEAAKSRASVINFLNTMVDEGFLDYIEETGKGGYHRVYSLNALSKTERTFRNEIRNRFMDRLRDFWKSEDEEATPLPDCYGSYGSEECIIVNCIFTDSCETEETKSFEKARRALDE